MRPSAGQVPDHGPDPLHALGVEAVDRFVEDQGVRVAEERGGDTEPLSHAQGEPADPLVGDPVQAGHVDDLTHPTGGDPVRGGHRPQVLVGTATGVHRLGVQQDTDLPQRCGVGGVRLAVDGDRTGRRAVEPDDHPHRGRLPRPVGAQESCDRPRHHRERHAVHGGLVSIALGEVASLDHRPSLRRDGSDGSWCRWDATTPTRGRAASRSRRQPIRRTVQVSPDRFPARAGIRQGPASGWSTDQRPDPDIADPSAATGVVTRQSRPWDPCSRGRVTRRGSRSTLPPAQAARDTGRDG